MLGYKYSREEIYSKILFCPQTNDGVYWLTENLVISIMERAKSNKTDEVYSIERIFFSDKYFFTMLDLKLFMYTGKSRLHLGWLRNFNLRFNEDNKDILGKCLCDFRGKNKVIDIIDMYLLINDYWGLFINPS